MPGDVGLVAAFLTKALGFAVDETGYKEWSREKKLEKLMEGIDASILAHDEPAVNVLFDEYRWVRQQTGP